LSRDGQRNEALLVNRDQVVRLAITKMETHKVINPLKATTPAAYTLATLFRVCTAKLGFMSDLSENRVDGNQSIWVYTVWQPVCQSRLTVKMFTY